jgi:surfactin synthase thioesterase subunit
LRGDLEVVDTYLYRRRRAVRLRCPVFVLTGAADAEATVEDTEAWDLETEHPPLVRRYDGDHRFLQTATASVLQDVASDLRAVRSAIYDVISQ